MTNSALAVRDQPHQLTVLTNEQLQYISKTEFVPPGLRGNLPAILACVATGRSIGVSDMTALRSIHVIDGKPTFSAELMVLLVRRAGHSISGEVADGKAIVRGKRADNGDTMTATWTMDMADRAGLVGKGNWKKYPEAMLWARAVSQLCRMLFADCFAGTTYTTEELGADDTGEHGVPEEVFAEPAAESTDGSTTAPGSVNAPTSWQELKLWREAEGITDDVLAAAGKELFPGREPRTLTPEEIGVLWAWMLERAQAEVSV